MAVREFVNLWLPIKSFAAPLSRWFSYMYTLTPIFSLSEFKQYWACMFHVSFHLSLVLILLIFLVTLHLEVPISLPSHFIRQAHTFEICFDAFPNFYYSFKLVLICQKRFFFAHSNAENRTEHPRPRFWKMLFHFFVLLFVFPISIGIPTKLWPWHSFMDAPEKIMKFRDSHSH